jgi:nitric oxide reductase large subunit
VSLWQYRYTASAMGQQGRELLSRGVAIILLLMTVESLISFTDFIIKKEVMELKTISYCSYGTNYLGK